MRKVYFGLALCLLLQAFTLWSQEQKPAGFYFGGKEFHLGMSYADAMNRLSECCTLSPSARTIKEDSDTPPGKETGYFILSRDKSSPETLGGIWFRNHKIVSISRDLARNVDPSDDNLVAFVRELKRSLPEETTTALVTVRHEQASNGESDILTLSFPSGRRLNIRIVTLDSSLNSKRDFVSLEEIYGPID
jgi:hypothetical protein